MGSQLQGQKDRSSKREEMTAMVEL